MSHTDGKYMEINADETGSDGVQKSEKEKKDVRTHISRVD